MKFQIPTIDQDTAMPGREPNETLKKFRADKVLLPKHKPQGRVKRHLFSFSYFFLDFLNLASFIVNYWALQIYFGQTFVCKESLTNELKAKRIRVGDPVYVLKVASSYDDVAANCEMKTITLEWTSIVSTSEFLLLIMLQFLLPTLLQLCEAYIILQIRPRAYLLIYNK